MCKVLYPSKDNFATRYMVVDIRLTKDKKSSNLDDRPVDVNLELQHVDEPIVQEPNPVAQIDEFAHQSHDLLYDISNDTPLLPSMTGDVLTPEVSSMLDL